MKATRNSQPFSCTLEVVTVQETRSDAFGENVIRVMTGSGQNLVSLSISSEIGQHLTNALAQAIPTIDIGGGVNIIFDGEHQSTDSKTTIPLNQLVAKAVSPEMLEDEPEAASMLTEFRNRLLKSLEHVDEAIASLPKS